MSDREKEIRERLAKATPGPWYWDTQDFAANEGIANVWDSRYWEGRSSAVAHDISLEADGEFIAHAPEDLAWCLAEIERLKGGAAEQRREFKAYRDMAVANENLLKAIVEEQQAEIERLKDPSTILREAARIQAMAPRGRGLP